jgi:protein-tyrosine-phosphatase
LALSDRSPTELARQFGLASNLLAHHLDVLSRAGLIDRVASTADGRRRYVRLRRSALDELSIGNVRAPRRMVFVCSLNSARSQLAAAMWTSRTGHRASSAGTRPADRVHPGAIAAAARFGLDLGTAAPRMIGAIDDDSQLVTVCDQAHHELDPPATAWHWSIPDPVPAGTDAAFDDTVRELDQRITALTETGAHDHG